MKHEKISDVKIKMMYDYYIECNQYMSLTEMAKNLGYNVSSFRYYVNKVIHDKTNEKLTDEIKVVMESFKIQFPHSDKIDMGRMMKTASNQYKKMLIEEGIGKEQMT